MIHSGRQRTERRGTRRRGAGMLLAALAALAVAVAAWALLAHGSAHSSAGAARHGAGAAVALQAANGPLKPPLRRQPLNVALGPPDVVHVRFRQPPAEGLLFDLDSGRVLWRRHPLARRPIASLTKMMTALIVADRDPPDARVLITRQAVHFQGSGVGVLPRGKRVQLETLLYGLLLPSGNDAAIALAQHVAGTQRAFVALMNARARAMGLACTHYTTVDGLLDKGNHSCAVDLAALARAMLDRPRLARIVRTFQAIRPLPIKGGKVYLYNNNPLLRLHYPGTIGIKTGYTDAAGHCLVAAAERGGHRLGVVLLHSPDTGTQASQLLDRGFRALAATRSSAGRAHTAS